MSAFDDDRTQLAEKNQLELLCFKVTKDSTIFAVNVFKVREAVKFQELTLLPDSNPCVQGLLTLRNEILPVVDLKEWISEGSLSSTILNQPTTKDSDFEKQIIICEFNDTTIGVKVQKAEYILRRNWEDIHVPISNDFGAKINNYTKNDNGEIVYIVDIETMLAELFPFLVEEKMNEAKNLELIDIKDRNKMVLVAEDSKTALKALTMVLDKLELTYKTFVNGQELLDYVAAIDSVDRIGMIITDLEMPVTSGFTVIKNLKSDTRTKDIPIIVNSSMTGQSNQKMAEQLNAQGFVGKTKPNEIAGFVREFLGA